MSSQLSYIQSLLPKQVIQLAKAYTEYQIQHGTHHTKHVYNFNLKVLIDKYFHKNNKTPTKKGLSEIYSIQISQIRNSGDFECSCPRNFVHQMQLLKPEINIHDNLFIDDITTIVSQGSWNTDEYQCVYIHIPFCLKKCFYCAFPVHIIGSQIENQAHYREQLESQYLNYLIKEIQQNYKSEYIDTLYLGGGTPSLLTAKSLQKILEQFRFSANPEITIEADPGTFDKHQLKDIISLGFNRLSFGVQSLDQNTLKALNRSHTLQNTYTALDNIMNVMGNYKQCSFDVLYNLPNHLSDCNTTIEELIKLQPGHLSLYSLSIEQGSYYHDKLQYRDEQHPLPNNQQQADKFIEIHNILKIAGYDHYEVSNFALMPQYESRHNKMYWQGDAEFYGFGMGATSLQGGIRSTRPKSLKQYYEYVDSKLGLHEEEEHSEFEYKRVLLMSRLRTKWGISRDLLSVKQIERIQQYSNYIVSDQNYIKLRIPEGYLVCDEIVAQLQDIR